MRKYPLSVAAMTLTATLLSCLSFSILASPVAEPVKLEKLTSDVTIGFSPGGTAQSTILDVINQAQHNILIAAYSFTSRDIATALLQAHRRGVDIAVVADRKANSNEYTAVTYLANNNIPVRLNSRYDIMHNKFIVTDGHTVETGSFNFSAAAAKKNAENIIVLWNAPDAARTYQAEFMRLWSEASPLPERY